MLPWQVMRWQWASKVLRVRKEGMGSLPDWGEMWSVFRRSNVMEKRHLRMVRGSVASPDAPGEAPLTCLKSGVW